jgi:hypothetical protein
MEETPNDLTSQSVPGSVTEPEIILFQSYSDRLARERTDNSRQSRARTDTEIFEEDQRGPQ